MVRQVVSQYKQLLKIVLKKNLPVGFEPSATHRMLEYESYYHLGMALQNVGFHAESVKAYTNAMMSMDIRKVCGRSQYAGSKVGSGWVGG